MPQKNSSKKKEQTPAYPLRRSPRFLQIVLVDPEDPKTPNPEPQRRTRVHSSAPPLNFTGKVEVSSRCRSSRSKSKESSQNLDKSRNARQRSDTSKTRSKKSSRLSPCAEDCNEEKLSPSSKLRKREFERRVTRSSSHGDVDTNAKKTGYDGSTGNTGNDCSLTEEGVNTSKKCKAASRKNKVKSSKKRRENNSDEFETLASDDNPNEVVLSVTKKPTLDEALPEKTVSKMANQLVVTTPSVVHEQMNKKDINKKIQKNIGVKRKRNQHEGISGITSGWTKDQESALERAYLKAKPTPQFWKKVSRMVPGKSAQECFDKVHGSHLTPPPPRLRSRARLPNSQDPTLSASKLLSSSPTTKRPKSRKQKSHVIQRTVRHMLQNQYKAEQASEADLFSVLEPTFSLTSNVMLTTPVRNLDLDGVFTRSSTAHKKSRSRFSASHGPTLVSPPVLKQVKNMALHEKYLDHLLCREASRKVASKKAGKSNGSEKGESSAERKDAFKAAKNALEFGAKQAIDEFEFKQGMALIDIFEDECAVEDDEDGDQVLF